MDYDAYYDIMNYKDERSQTGSRDKWLIFFSFYFTSQPFFLKVALCAKEHKWYMKSWNLK